MASHRVERTSKETSWIGRSHLHIAALCLAGDEKVPTAEAIQRIKAGIDSYYTFEGGQRADVEVADRCAQCGVEYLRTGRDATIGNNLVALPDC